MNQENPSTAKVSQERQIFRQAIQIGDQDELKEFLTAACGTGTPLRERLDKLLAARSESDSNLLRQVVASDPGTSEHSEDTVEQSLTTVDLTQNPMIESYMLLEELGQGGMGTVYMAEQQEPIRRKVALKVIKAGMDTEEVIARFEAERQVLGMMEHPNIAKVLDGGTTSKGRPYFVMELVRGVPVTSYCQENRLSLTERLELFIDMCRAVQHAHQKGIIHRDLKPGNLLVTMQDQRPIVKVIDFGVAKALDQNLTDRTQFTHFTQMVGTPLYMSPEQAQMSGLDVDTRSDVYSLGVVLYELLTGTTPFERESLSGLAVDDIRRLIREKDPERPSARVSTLKSKTQARRPDQASAKVTGNPSQLKRELDWVVMKALQKDRNQRYESAADLARDIERFLSNEPVQARAPTWSYTLAKAFKRHRGAISAAVFVFAALITGAGVAIWQAVIAREANTLAETRATTLAAKNLQLQRTTRLAENARRSAEALLYAVEIQLASGALLDKDARRVRSLLTRHQNTAVTDKEPFEWLYLNRAVMSEPVWQVEELGDISDVRVAPDRRHVAVVSRASVLRIFDMETGGVVGESQIDSLLNSVCWAPSGMKLACACSDGSVRLLTVTGQRTKVPTKLVIQEEKRLQPSAEGRPEEIVDSALEANDAVFAAEGKVLITAGDDTRICFWDLATGECKVIDSGHRRAIEQLAISPDGTHLATASSDATLRIWHVERRKPLIERRFSGRVVCAEFSPDGALCAGGSIDGLVRVVHVSSGKTSDSKSLDGIESLAFLPDPLRLAAGDRAGVLNLKDVKVTEDELPSLSVKTTWSAHNARVSGLRNLPSTNTLISASRGGALTRWDRIPEVPVSRVARVSSFDFGSDGTLFLGLQQVLGVQAKSGTISFRGLPSPTPWTHLASAEKADRIALASENILCVVDTSLGEVVAQWPIANAPHRIAISADGKLLATTDYYRDGVELRSTEAPDSIRKLPARSSRALAFSPVSKTLAAGDFDDCLIYDLDSERSPVRLAYHDSTLTTIDFSPDGRRVVTGSDDRRVGLWDAVDGKLRNVIPAHPARVESVHFSRDGERIASCGGKGHVRIWHSETLQPLLQIFLDTSETPEEISFSPDQTCLAIRMDSELHLINAGETAGNSLKVIGSKDAMLQSGGAKLRLLGDLPGGTFHSVAAGISNDGSAVVGLSNIEDGFRSYIWTEAEGLRQLGADRARALNSQADCATADGKLCGGAGGFKGEKGYAARLWFADGSTQQLMPGEGSVVALSHDGRVAVFQSRQRDLVSSWVWREGEISKLTVGESSRQNLAVRDVSPNGTDILANQFALAGSTLPAKDPKNWIEARPVVWKNGVREEFPYLDSSWNWIAQGMSADVATIVGNCEPPGSSFDDPGGRMFVIQAGELLLVDPPPGYLEILPRGVSDDGRRVVGRIGRRLAAGGGRAFLWTAESGIQDLNQLCQAEMGGRSFKLSDATAISGDGKFVVGYGAHGDGRTEAFRLELP